MRHRRNVKSAHGAGLGYVIAMIVFAALFFAGIFYKAYQEYAEQRRAIPPFYSSAAHAQPLPSTVEPAKFLVPKVKRAYAVAKAIPAVLAQQPCYCACQRSGHRSLLDCFKDEHAAGCTICIDEALYVDKMNAKGQCVEAIRDGIIRGDWQL